MGLSTARCNCELCRAEKGPLNKVTSLVGDDHGSPGTFICTAEEDGYRVSTTSEVSDSDVILQSGCA